MAKNKIKNSLWDIRPATTNEISVWDELITTNPDGGNFLQTHSFATQKGAFGWKPLYFTYTNGSIVVRALALSRHIYGLGVLWYFPGGPGVSSVDFGKICEVTHHYITRNNLKVFLVQMEPEFRSSIPVERDRRIRLSERAQAHTSTVIIRLDRPDLIASFRKRARYGIHLGEREHITVKSVAATEENFQHMYALMKTVSGGRGVTGIRPYDYYRRFWQTYISSGLGMLYFAYEQDVPIIGAFVIKVGRKAFYKDGGSSPQRRSKGASYLLQWQIMQDMRNSGIKTYDMLGTPPSTQRRDTSHYLYGVGLFKRAFSEDIVDYYGMFNIPLSSLKYTIWKNCFYPLLRRLMRWKNRYFY